MTAHTDLTRWNRAGLTRFRYVDGNAPVFLELLRESLARRFGAVGGGMWDILHDVPQSEDYRERLHRLEAQYTADRRDVGWEIVRLFARACQVLTSHVEAYANEGFLGTATQWDNVRRLVEMLDYHPAPPASAATSLVLVAKPGARGTVPQGFQVKHAPKSGAPVVFETLEDVVIDAALNELRPAGYERNPTTLTGAVLTFEGAVKNLKTGEPVVLEDERTWTLRAYLVQGVLEQAQRTQVTVRPRLWRGFEAGYTIVHAQPADRLEPKAPVQTSAIIGRALHLAEPPRDLQPGEVVYISDSVKAYYRRVVAVRGLTIVFDKELGIDQETGQLNLAHATVARAEVVSVNRLPGRTGEDNDILIIRVAGDHSRLANQQIADLCIDAGVRSIAQYKVTAADYIPAEQKVPNAGYTILRVMAPLGGECTLANPQSLWVPPVGGRWAVDRFLETAGGHLPRALVTSKPKKTAAGDIAVVVRGNQTAWARLGSVETDMEPGEARLTAEARWQDRGGGDFYLADTSVYAHFKQQLRVSGWQNNPAVLSGSTVQLNAVPSGLKRGAKILVECAGSDPLVTTVSRVEGTAVTLSHAVPDGCTVGGIVLRGNVVNAGHGESKPEKVLGSGSAAQSNQVFLLQVADVSFVADSTQTTGVRADITVRVAEREWTQVATLNDSGPADPHYVVRMTEDGYILVGFGDGSNGRRLPSGINNVRVSYRKGTGLGGNLAAGSLTKPVKPHALVASVRQPTAAIGGNDMEGTASLRENAPASLLTLERAVSLDDFGHLAASHSSVWQARAFLRPSGFGQREQVEVIVVPATGGPLGELAATLQGFLLRHSVPGVAVAVTEYTEVSFDVEVDLTVDEDAFVADDVRAAVERELAQAFGLFRRRLGQDVYLSEVYKVVEDVVGVMHSTIALNGNQQIRRLFTNERSVRVLGACVVRVNRSGSTAAPATGGPPTAPPATTQLELERPIGRRPTIVVDGVGPVYAGRLAAAGVTTVKALAALDPDRTAIQVPRPKLWEAVAKAQFLLEFEVDPGVAGPVLDLPLLEVGGMTAAALTQLTGESVERVTQLRALVRRLQVALDDDAFAMLTLREFVPR